jgi:hypothetical protein
VKICIRPRRTTSQEMTRATTVTQSLILSEPMSAMFVQSV